MPNVVDRQSKRDLRIGILLTEHERVWIDALAEADGVTMSDAIRLLIRQAAERRGLKDKIAA
jgi:hypothetical protein